MADYNQLSKLNELRQQGIISEEEFQREKTKILASTNPNVSAGGGSKMDLGMTPNNYLMLMHLSQFASVVVPLAGLVVPIVMWQSKKQDPVVDQHGRIIMNWMLSVLIYVIVSAILIFVIVGIFLLIALAIANIVFVIMAAVKANNTGEIWQYPMSIKFFAVDTNVARAQNPNKDILDA